MAEVKSIKTKVIVEYEYEYVDGKVDKVTREHLDYSVYNHTNYISPLQEHVVLGYYLDRANEKKTEDMTYRADIRVATRRL